MTAPEMTRLGGIGKAVNEASELFAEMTPEQRAKAMENMFPASMRSASEMLKNLDPKLLDQYRERQNVYQATIDQAAGTATRAYERAGTPAPHINPGRPTISRGTTGRSA